MGRSRGGGEAIGLAAVTVVMPGRTGDGATGGIEQRRVGELSKVFVGAG